MLTLRERLGRRVKYLRDQRNWTQEQLGEKAGLTYKYIGQIERAEVSPSLETLEKLSKAFGIGITKLRNFEKTKLGKTKEDIFQEFTNREVETIRKAVAFLKRIFGPE